MIVIYKDKGGNVLLVYKNGEFQEFFLDPNSDKIALDVLRYHIEYYSEDLDLKIFEET